MALRIRLGMDGWLQEAIRLANALFRHPYFALVNQALSVRDLRYHMMQVRIEFAPISAIGRTYPRSSPHRVLVTAKLAWIARRIPVGGPEYRRVVSMIGATILHEVTHLSFAWRGVVERRVPGRFNDQGYRMEHHDLGGVIFPTFNQEQTHLKDVRIGRYTHPDYELIGPRVPIAQASINAFFAANFDIRLLPF